MPGLVPGINAMVSIPGAWMAGTSPAMTVEEISNLNCPQPRQERDEF
jgi:hypothetical protein